MQITIDLDLIENSILNTYQKDTLKGFLEDNNSNSVTITDPTVTKPITEMNTLEVESVLIRLVIHINKSKLNQQHKERIDAGGYTVQVILSDPSLVYTVGLSVTSGVELAYQANMSTEFMSSIVNELAQDIQEHGLVTETTSKLYLAGEEELRVKLVLVEDKDNLIDKVTLGMGNPLWLIEKPDKVYQVLTGDERNLLPGEDGYDETFSQDFVYD